MIERKFHKLTVHFENVNQAQAIALKKLFEYMQHLGNAGSSRTCSIFADGDGDFRPKVSFEYPEELPEVKEIDGRKPNGDFYIDHDAIAWRIYHEPIDKEKPFMIGGPVGTTSPDGKDRILHTIVTEKGAQLLGVKESFYDGQKKMSPENAS